jgi:hypothetical protein
MKTVLKTKIAGQQIPHRGSSNTSLGSQTHRHQAILSQHSGRPQSTVMVTKNEVPDNHPERVWGIAQVPDILNH